MSESDEQLHDEAAQIEGMLLGFTAPVPEPTTMTLTAIATVAIAFLRRRRRTAR